MRGDVLGPGRRRATFHNLHYSYLALLLALLVAGFFGSKLSESRSDGAISAAVTAATPQLLSAAGEAQLHATLDAGKLADLRWPAFGKYQPEVRKFYDSPAGYLPWIRESRPSSQALAIIQILKNAEGEGLDPRRL